MKRWGNHPETRERTDGDHPETRDHTSSGKRSQNQNALLWLWRVSGRWKIHISGLLTVEIILSVMGVYSAWLFRDMVNRAVSGNRTLFFHTAAALMGLHGVMLFLRALLRFLRESARSGVENALRQRLFSVLLSREYRSVSAVHSGEWGNRLSSDARVAADGAVDILPDVVGMLIRMLGALILLVYLLPELTFILIPGGAALMLLTFLFRGKLKRMHRAQQEADGQVRIHFLEYLTNLLVVHSFSREAWAEVSAEEKLSAYRKTRMARNHFSNLCNVGFGAAMDGAYLFGTAWCGYRILTGSMSYGTLVGVMQLVGQIQAPFANLTGYLPRFYAMTASAERLMEPETWPPDLYGPSKSPEQIRHFYRDAFREIRLQNVSFSYPRGQKAEQKTETFPILRDVSLSVGRGEFIAFTGPSGCGKSTVLKLLMGFYPLDGGTRSLLAVDGETIPLTSQWRRLFAYVPQGNQLMAGTIREVVTFGDIPGAEKESDVSDAAHGVSDAARDRSSAEHGISDTAREEDIWAALTVACAADFVRAQPRGLDTTLGERGQGLSEGQMQRLAIARAVFSGHPILLLDEATSALDERTETRLLDNLRRETDRTVLIVTHRSAALTVCDREIRFSDTARNPSPRKKDIPPEGEI